MKSFSDYFNSKILNEARSSITEKEWYDILKKEFPEYKKYEKMAENEEHLNTGFKCPFKPIDVRSFYSVLSEFLLKKAGFHYTDDAALDRITFHSKEAGKKNYDDLMWKVSNCTDDDLFAFVFDDNIKFGTITIK